MTQSITVSETSDPLIGQTLGGKYKIRRLIGRGGVGLVYLATDVSNDREVVVKLLAPNWVSDAEAVARFEREAKRLNSLKHANIVTMHDYGHENKRAYLVMEYVQGELLSGYVQERGKLTLEQFVPIAAQILKGMGHAHSRELMIRDVKPSNIMLCERKGRANFVKILDFGLAKRLRGETPITEEHVMGTVGYLAPEAIKGEEIDLRVDVYALGVLFYYMLSGQVPFRGDNNAAVFYKTVNEPAPDLATVLPPGHNVPQGLIDLIHQCLEKDADKRPSDADAIVEQLIDVVPAALFRLPRAVGQRGSGPIPIAMGNAGVGNTGMVELLGSDPSAAHAAGAGASTGRLRAVTSPLPSIETSPSQPLTIVTGTHKAGVGLVAGSVMAAAVMAVLGGAAAVFFLSGNNDQAPAPSALQPSAAPAAVVIDKGAIRAEIESANKMVDEGNYDQAKSSLERVSSSASKDAELEAMHASASRRLLIARLLTSAGKFEEEGDIGAAVEAYRQVLKADEAHEKALAGLSRLTVKKEGEAVEAGVVYGSVFFNSRPQGSNLNIDGEYMGKTPARLNLPVGKHRVKISLRGYHTHDSTYEVAKDENQPLTVRLSGRKTSRRASSPAPAPAPTPVAAEPAPASEPAQPPSKPEPAKTSKKKPKRDSVFLPTKKTPNQPADEPKKKKKQGGGVFLPVGDAP